MADRLRHRGPDERGHFVSADGRCAVGFARLAVIDPAGSHQPMTSEDGSVTIAFNGEIYNFRELREHLAAEGCRFRTQGDTEVLLHLWRRDGIAMLDKITGMFALAIYDARAGRLVLARDRLGEKPLWYAVLADRIIFASEAKALLAHPQFQPALDYQALMLYLALGYIPPPWSIWKGIRKLPPAHWMEVSHCPAPPVRYWQPTCRPAPAGRAELIEQTRELVTRAVRQRMIADVPLGALLSGGIDSSIVTAVMAREAGRAGGVRTFTAGFDDSRYDERPAAAAVARRFGTDHTELLVHQDVTQSAIDDIVRRYDEPFADSSALPTYLICQAARRHVTVALVGDGGDEVFGGYDRYRAMHLANTMPPYKYLLYKVLGAAASAIAPHDEKSRMRRLARFSQILPLPPAMQYYRLRSLFDEDDLARLLCPAVLESADAALPQEWFMELYESPDVEDELTRSQWHDLNTYLPDDLLVKTDIASMACSLELRAPLLDHNLVDWGLSLPAGLKLSHGRGKAALREAFADILPPEVIHRGKKGFGVPLDSYLRGPLLGAMRDCFAAGKLAEHGVIQPAAAAGLANDHLAGRGDHRHRLWALLVLERWLDINGATLKR